MMRGTPSQVWGRGVPWPGLDGGGGYPIPGLGWEGYCIPRSTLVRSGSEGEVPRSGLDNGMGYPGHVWMVGGTPSQGWGVPQPGLDGGGYPGTPLVRSGW